MKVEDLIKKFTINPEDEIVNKFKLTKQFEKEDAYFGDGCFNCGDKINNKKLESSPWTGVQYCWKCNHLNVVYYADRMSGAYADTVQCFTEKE